MDIETLHSVAIYYFEHARSNCEFLKIYSFIEEDENYAFYGLFKCKKVIGLKKVILTSEGDFVDFVSF